MQTQLTSESIIARGGVGGGQVAQPILLPFRTKHFVLVWGWKCVCVCVCTWLVLPNAGLKFLWKGTPLPNNNISLLPHHLTLTLSTLHRTGMKKIELVKFLTIFYLFRIVFIFFCFRFNESHYVLCKNLCIKYCGKSLDKQSSEFNPFYI